MVRICLIPPPNSHQNTFSNKAKKKNILMHWFCENKTALYYLKKSLDRSSKHYQLSFGISTVYTLSKQHGQKKSVELFLYFFTQ